LTTDVILKNSERYVKKINVKNVNKTKIAHVE